MRHLLSTACLLFAAAAAASPPPPATGELARWMPAWMAATHVRGAAVAHVHDGRIASVEVFGERAPGVPMTADAHFNVASLTKPVFALLTLRLIADGTLSLDSRLAEHWVDPDIADDERRFALTPRLTLSHQSGLPNWRRDTLDFEFAPGARHEYSGEGYEYTRHAIERMTGRTLRELMQAHVLDAAGMTATAFGWSDAVDGHEVTGYDIDGRPLDTDLQSREPNAAAHMFTTVGDYARFTQWVIAGAGLPDALYAEMARPQAQHADPAEYFGLGWRLVRTGDETVLAHDGRERGVRTQVFVLPQSREALVLLTNSEHGELLVQPIVAATLADGDALMRQVAVDTWHYLHSMPPAAIQPMMQGITRSPSFMSKLLYAVDATLVEQAGLSADQRAHARQAIDPFVFGMVDGSVDQPTALRVFEQLVDTSEETPRLRRTFTTEQAQAWIAALRATDNAG